MNGVGLVARRLLLGAAAIAAGFDHGVSAFHVALDRKRIQALQGQFALAPLPRRDCTAADHAAAVAQTAAGSQRIASASATSHAGSFEAMWSPDCAPGLTKHLDCEYTGFQYSMEWYFMQILRDNPQYCAPSVEEASFIYFPQCVSQVYFALRETYNVSHWVAIEMAEQEYLVPLLRWAHASPWHRRYGGRNFWTVFSMDLGRQDFPRSAAWLEEWSVGSLTGSEMWIHQQNLFHPSAILSERSDESDCWQEDTAPVVVASEMFPARQFRNYDTVISIPSRFEPTERSAIFDGRPVLVFFAGSPNSCARRRVLELYSDRPGFDVSTHISSGEVYQEKMWSSKFCLVMRGSSHTNNVRLYDVLAHGCVPVVLSDDFQAPLDRWLPWSDIAVFLPTSAIPRLEHILTHEVSEARRLELFQNVALGAGSSKELARKSSLFAASGVAGEGKLEADTLWSGLSAARIFNWHGSAFWILFLADVQQKLTARFVPSKENATRRTHDEKNEFEALSVRLFSWRRVENRKPQREARPSRPRQLRQQAHQQGGPMEHAERGGPADSDASDVSAASMEVDLVNALQWLHADWKRHLQAASPSAALPLPGAIVDCGPDGSAAAAAAWLEALSTGSVGCCSSCSLGAAAAADDDSASELAHGFGLCPVRAEARPELVATTLVNDSGKLRELRSLVTKRGWNNPTSRMRWHGELLVDDERALVTALAAASRPVANVVFLLRVGLACPLLGESSSSASLQRLLLSDKLSLVKFLLFSSVQQRGGAAAFAGTAFGECGVWLCFAVPRHNGAATRLRPLFSPFTTADDSSVSTHSAFLASTTAVFCGREDDPDLDKIVRIVNGGAVGAGAPPARWGAAPPPPPQAAPRARGRGGVVAANVRLGRFLYEALWLGE